MSGQASHASKGFGFKQCVGMCVLDGCSRGRRSALCCRGVAHLCNAQQGSAALFHRTSLNKTRPTMQVLHFQVSKLATHSVQLHKSSTSLQPVSIMNEIRGCKNATVKLRDSIGHSWLGLGMGAGTLLQCSEDRVIHGGAYVIQVVSGSS